MKPLVIALCSMLLVIGMAVTPHQAGPLGSGNLAFAKSIGGSIELIDLPGLRVISMEPVLAKYTSRTGTIENVDPAGLQVTILTDVGQKESLPVTKASVLVGVGQGDRVSCEMNADGKVTKIVKTAPIPEVSPAPEPRG